MSNWPNISILDFLDMTKQNATLYLVLLILSDSQAVPMTRTVKVGTFDEHHTEFVYGLDISPFEQFFGRELFLGL